MSCHLTRFQGSRVTQWKVAALRWFPPGTPGKWQLARRLLGRYLDRRDVLIEDRFGCAYLVPSLRESIGFPLLVDGVYEPSLTQLVLNRLQSGATFVDVGASIGTFTIPTAMRLGSRGTVVAIEASPSIAGYLKHNVVENRLTNIVLEHCAIGDRDAPAVDFYEAPSAYFGNGSLAPPSPNARPVPVVAKTLDTILGEHQLETVDIIKADIEGFETALFKGARRALSASKAPLITFEFNTEAEARVPGSHGGEAQAVLKALGYEIWRLTEFARRHGRPLRYRLTQGFETLVAIKGG